LYTIIIAILIVVGFSSLYIFGNKEQYYFIVRIYNILEYSIIAYFFSLQIKNKYVRNILSISIIPFFAFCVYDFLSVAKPEMPYVPLAIEYVILLAFIIYFFFEVLQATAIEPIYQKPVFWISVAFILNYSGNFFLFLYSKNSYNDDLFKHNYTIIYSTVTIIKNVLLCISILIKDNTPNPTKTTFSPDFDLFHPIVKQT